MRGCSPNHVEEGAYTTHHHKRVPQAPEVKQHSCCMRRRLLPEPYNAEEPASCDGLDQRSRLNPTVARFRMGWGRGQKDRSLRSPFRNFEGQFYSGQKAVLV